MSKLKTPQTVETAFASYELTEQLGEGGAGRVYGGIDPTGIPVAVKVLTNTSSDKRRRFKNETAFLSQNRHPNIVTVIDHGIVTAGAIKGPFYVMQRFSGSLRDVIKPGLSPDVAMLWFSQVLDGVEAAHFQTVTHRDLKPENILINNAQRLAAIADFGIASFTEDMLYTLVETTPTTRLANFQYAAPEQRIAGRPITAAADIYALGLILNELFTGVVPHGTEYKQIEAVAPSHAFLDRIVAAMLRQNPSERPAHIGDVKGLIQRYRAEAVSLQKLSVLRNTVIPAGQVDEPLAYEPPKLIAVEYKPGVLHLTLDRRVNDNWVRALQNMGNFTSVMNVPPTAFRFDGTQAMVSLEEHNAQAAVNYFKDWLPAATRVLKYNLEQEAQHAEAQRVQRLQQERQAEERLLQINRNLTI